MNTTFEQYIQANAALAECYERVPADEFSALSLTDQQNVCKSEASAVRGFLASG